jgi:lipoprotein NlpI
MRRFAAAALVLGLLGAATGQDKKDVKDEKKEKELAKLFDDIEAAVTAKKYADVIPLAKKAAELDPKNPAVPFAAARAHEALRQHAEAATAWTKVVELEPKAVRALDSRGDCYLKMGQFKEAIEDFDKYLKADPKFAPDHWRRGIALYYAGRFKDGADQFDLHRKVNPEDVENSAWHYLCNARATTPKKAREELIPVTKDGRVPMNKVLDLFAGKIKPQDVLDAAEKAKLEGEALKEARFYANLYVALFYESEGDAKSCLTHMTAAVEKYPIGHYMWDVAGVHLKLLKEKK